jgi:hypothetical protein
LAVHNLLPDKKRVLTVINTDGYKTRVGRIELFLVARELAQLARAVGSPVPAIEDQEHAFATQRPKAKDLAVLVLQGEVRRWLASSGSDLWLRQDLRRSGKPREQQK